MPTMSVHVSEARHLCPKASFSNLAPKRPSSLTLVSEDDSVIVVQLTGKPLASREDDEEDHTQNHTDSADDTGGGAGGRRTRGKQRRQHGGQAGPRQGQHHTRTRTGDQQDNIKKERKRGQYPLACPWLECPLITQCRKIVVRGICWPSNPRDAMMCNAGRRHKDANDRGMADGAGAHGNGMPDEAQLYHGHHDNGQHPVYATASPQQPHQPHLHRYHGKLPQNGPPHHHYPHPYHHHPYHHHHQTTPHSQNMHPHPHAASHALVVATSAVHATRSHAAVPHPSGVDGLGPPTDPAPPVVKARKGTKGTKAPTGTKGTRTRRSKTLVKAMPISGRTVGVVRVLSGPWPFP